MKIIENPLGNQAPTHLLHFAAAPDARLATPRGLGLAAPYLGPESQHLHLGRRGEPWLTTHDWEWFIYIYGSMSKPCTPSVHIKIAGIYGCE